MAIVRTRQVGRLKIDLPSYSSLAHDEDLRVDAGELAPFDKYASAAEGLHKPSSAGRAVASGAEVIERVDRIVQMVGKALGMSHPTIDVTVSTVDAQLEKIGRRTGSRRTMHFSAIST